MAFPKRSLEWRRVGGKQSAWHLFLVRQSSVCGRVTSNGQFDFVEAKPAKSAKVCRFCQQEVQTIGERIKQVL